MASEPTSAGAPPVPQDADDTLGMHFKSLLSSTGVLLGGSLFVGVAFGIGASASTPLIGLAAAGGATLLTLLIVYVFAANRASDDFFTHYAKARGLSRVESGDLPPSTPLLRKGDRRSAEELMSGTLPGGVTGTVARYTYEVDTRDSDGDRDVDYYRFTVAYFDLPELAPRIADLHCERRSGFRFMDSAEDAFRRMERVELESEALDKRYEIFRGPQDDLNWVKQLFSPSFIVWLTEQAPDGIGFELSAGALCVNTKGHHDSATELDTICEAGCFIATRLREEAAE